MAAGPQTGKIVFLLHGFPEFWYSWRKQIPALAAAGFRVVAPDQRGYNQSSKPPLVSDYHIDKLAADVLAIADQLGAARICLAGHDWGAAVAWNVAIRHPDRVERLAILNVPHPSAMLKYLRTQPRQMLRSWYMLSFQIPALPERLFAANNFQAATRALLGSSQPGTFSPADLDLYRQAWAQPGAMTAMINWYRAIFRARPVFGRVSAPTRILWGMQDRFLLPGLAAESLQHCDRAELLPFPNATHWVHHEEPDRVNQLLIELFG